MEHLGNAPDIDDIIDSFSERLEKGETPSITEYTRRFPELAAEINAALPALVMLNRVDQKPARKLAFDDSIPEIIGDYQIIQEVGRGGMGIVFEAQHLTMRRRVALKVLPKSSAEKPNYLSRFITEARSAGQLHHTNIVPVFEVGEAEGLNYYTMQFICGDNLDRVIEDIKKLRGNETATNHKQHHSTISLSLAKNLLSTAPFESEEANALAPLPTETLETRAAETQVHEPTPAASVTDTESSADLNSSGSSYYRRVAQIGTQIADALAHAHHHGVLHRDVKPGNLILDADGVAWITDFGLAKAGTDGLTLTGDIIGTLRYMAPERFRGQGDRRSDIYSLGLTLYEMCALQSAFVNDRGQLVADVQTRAIRPIREIDPTIPIDLETIISKTIEHQPENRYQNASDLAEDLERFVNDRPIKARRVSVAEKIIRICRRNPVAATLTGCILALIGTLIIGSFQFALYKAEQTRNEVNLRKRLETNLYNTKIDQAQMRLLTRREGQRTQALAAVREATELLVKLDNVHPDFIEKEKVKLRSEAIAALAMTDIEESWVTNFPTGTGSRFRCAIDKAAQRYALGHDTGPLEIRRISDGTKLISLNHPTDPAWMIEFDPTGRYLASIHHKPGARSPERDLFIWDLENPEQPFYKKKNIRYFAFSPDATKLAISSGNQVEIKRVADQETIHSFVPQFNDPGNPIDRSRKVNPKVIKFSSCGNKVAISDRFGDRVEIWDFETEPTFEKGFALEDSFVMSFDWDDRRQIMVIGNDQGSLSYWRYGESDEPHISRIHQNAIVKLFLHPRQETVVSYAWDNTNRITDMIANRELLCVYKGILMHSGFSDDGRIGFVHQNEMMGLWRLSNPVFKAFSVPDRYGVGACFHPIDTNIIARVVDRNIEFWDLRTETLAGEVAIQEAKHAQFSPDGTQLIAGGVAGISRVNVRIHRQNSTCRVEIGEIKQLSPSEADWLVAPPHEAFAGSFLCTQGSTVYQRSLSDGKVIKKFDSLPNLSEISLTADGKFLIGGTWHGKGVRIWDTKTGKTVQSILDDDISATVYADPSNPKRFATFGTHYRLWEFDQTQTPRLIFEGQGVSTRGILSNDGVYMTSKRDSYHLELVDASDGRKIAEMETLGSSRIVKTEFAPDGSALLLACFDNLQVIDIEQLRASLRELNLDW